ncbi:MAG: ammonium transporter, partial [Anaerolineaceae bacterium]
TWISFMIWGVVVGALVQPIVANWAWGGGWLFGLYKSGLERPYVDFAGSGVVHMVGGWAALAGAWVLGPRLGKYNKDGSANAMPGHNLNMAAIGTFILAFGWFGFNPGSTLGASGSGNLRIGEVAVVTMLAGAAGSVAAMAYAKATLRKYDPGYMINGILAGLVAITAPSGYVSPILAVIIGALAGVLVCVSLVFVEKTLKIDDPVGAFSVHGVCGAFGVLAVGLFADGTAPDWLVVGHPIKGLFFGDGRQLVAQVIGMAAIAVWSFGTSFVLFKVLMAMGVYRSKPEDELLGLDLPEMGTHAYPVEDMPSERGIEPGTFIPGVTPAR